MEEPQKRDYSPPRIRPVIALLRSSLPGDWFLHDVVSLTTKRVNSLNFQVLIRFRSAETGTFKDVEMPVEWFPLFTEGARWRAGRPLEYLSPLGDYEIDDLVPPWQAKLFWDEDLHAWVPDDSGKPGGQRKSALVLHTKLGNQLWIPQAEILRALYFSIPQAIVCFLSGLSVHGCMSSPAFELWRPQLTGWISRPAGIAQIQRSRNLTSLDAKRIAKLIFHTNGAMELETLWSWVQFEFRKPSRHPGLPPLGLPFKRFLELQANWIALPDQPVTKVRRRLVTRILEFRSEEPYQRLLEGSDNDNRRAPPSPKGRKPHGWGGSSKARPNPPVSVLDVKPDSELQGFEILGVGVRDLASEERPTELNEKTHTITEPSGRVLRNRKNDVDSASLGGLAERGTRVAPASIGESEDPSRFAMSDDLKAQSQWIKLALRQLAKHCANTGIAFSTTWLPAKDIVYVFRWPANNTEYANKRSISRCFLVVQIELGGRICYLVDAERRVISDTFPIGVLRRKHDPILQDSDLNSLARRFETAHRKGAGWLTKDSLPDDIVALPIRRTRLETEDQKNHFSNRAALRVVELIQGKSRLPR